MEHFVSPRYDHTKLENPKFSDLVDVFEDSWQVFVFEPAAKLLENPTGDVAAMTLVSAYFEAIWIYRTGEDSDRRSKEFFVNGFQRCFASSTEGIETAAGAIYKHIRCGLAHTGMLSRKVYFSREGAQAFYLTYPNNPDGTLNTRGELASIVVNPHRMYEGAVQHFKRYIEALRSGNDPELSKRFEQAVNHLWGIGEGENIIGMTEEQFKGGA